MVISSEMKTDLFMSSTGHQTLDIILELYRERELSKAVRTKNIHAEKVRTLKRNFLARLASFSSVDDEHRDKFLNRPDEVALVFVKKRLGENRVFSILEFLKHGKLVVIFYEE